MVAMEAVAHGVPVVASAAGGLGEMIKQGRHGLLFPNNDEEGLTSALIAIAAGQTFPDHVIGEGLVEQFLTEFNVGQFVTKIRAMSDAMM
jgi:glycosyltransferase involved in cell wall biosynthesis